MRPSVTAIVRSTGAGVALARTIEALAAQVRRPDAVVVTTTGTTRDRITLPPGLPGTVLTVPDSRWNTVVAAAAADLGGLTPDQWLWLLDAGDAPRPDALSAFEAQIERSPSVAVAGPKRVDGDRILEIGRTETTSHEPILLGEGELDQGQFDDGEDVLAVGLRGALVQRGMWVHLRGLDPALDPAGSETDGGLDFGCRARLAGARVVVVPDAVVDAPQPAQPGWTASRRARLHRWMTTSPAFVVPLQWLALLPLALLRAFGALVTKQPRRIPGELVAGVAAIFTVGRVVRARREIARVRRAPWSSLDPLRRSAADQRRLRAIEREAAAQRARGGRERAAFLTGGGALSLIAGLAIGAAAFAPLLGRTEVTGGAALALGDFGTIWAATGWTGQLPQGVAPDPFSIVLAVLGTATFWQPSLSIVLLLLLAPAIAALGTWLLTATVTTHTPPRVAAAITMAAAPVLFAGAADGRIGAVVAHVSLPWLLLAMRAAHRSWAALGAAALLAAVVVAAAPSLAPALLVLLVVSIVTSGRVQQALVAVPALLIFLPLALAQFGAGRPLALLADPGVPFGSQRAPAWQLALGFPAAGLGGWNEWLGMLPGVLVAALVALVLAPLGVGALIGLFRGGSGRVAGALGVALAGLVTAVVVQQVSVVPTALDPVTVWSGPGLSLYWVGLALAAAYGFDRPGSLLPVLQGVGVVLAALPLLGSVLSGQAAIAAGTTRVPAIVAAQSDEHPEVGTLILTPVDRQGVRAELVRGDGGTFDSVPTALTTSPSRLDPQLAQLAADLVAGSDLGLAERLAGQGVDWVLLAPGTDEGAGRRQDARVALDASPTLERVSDTVRGTLWRSTVETRAASAAGSTDAPAGLWLLSLPGALALALAAITAIPGGGRGRHQ